MPIIVDTAQIRISFEPGATDYAIISFAGIGFGMGGVPVEEFRRSIAGTAAAYFATDKTRGWYNAAFDQIHEILTRHIQQQGFKRAATLGNSMGGFGAMLFASALPNVSRSLAFAPQSAMCPAVVPWETRWSDLTSQVETWTVPDLVPLLGNGEHHVVYGTADPLDVRHAERLATAPGVRLHPVEGSGHEVAADMKRRGHLQRMLELLHAP